MRRTVFAEEHEVFRTQFRRFVEKEVEPKVAEWNLAGQCDRGTWRRMGEQGYLGCDLGSHRRLPVRPHALSARSW